MPEPLTLQVRHNPTEQRFEANVEGWLCRCDYRLERGVMLLVHTEVPPLLEGRGIAAQLVRAAIDYARAQQIKLRPRCSYVRVYFERHPPEKDVLG